ncbi:hypothetical protein V495_05922 [Pseudogymnoascus sp. VKM F-4514 (FW-929)]|nr:hypothetical protein V495_05922 [Pseudogymnoascus sp. VKM F-4514 (FW-929)]KFY56548.1 hypothetical protein V497_06166 [Pseudogymnoascus sp. VKM F-4516 (FW-969)]
MAVLSRKSYPDANSQHFDPETGNCSIEFYLACKDTYRVAPNDDIPVLWPYNIYKASDAGEELFGQLEMQIQRVLESYGITTQEISIHTLVSKGPPRERKDTIIIKTHDESNATWKEAVSKIYNEIVEPAAISAQLQMWVEIRNEDLMYKDYSHAIRDRDALEILERAESRIVEAVREFCGGMWSYVSIHERGRAPRVNKKKPAAVVGIKPGSVNAWGAFEERIIGIVESVVLPGEVDVYVDLMIGVVEEC